MTNTKYKLAHPFHFDGNQWFGMVETQGDWQSLLASYPIDEVLDAKMVRYDDKPERRPSFGFRVEHIGGVMTLEQWAKDSSIDLRGMA